jgi:uncharacterized YigZ family protein
MDTFSTIAAAAEGSYKDRGSKFLAFAYPVGNEDEVKERVDSLRRKYFDARHHCYAYRLGADGSRFRASDDGEPANSAGKPILGQLTAHGVTNVLVVVVRYFGGILLGVGGLMQAYKHASADALANAEIITDTITETCTLTFDYPALNKVLKVVKDMNLECLEQDFNLTCTMRIKVRKSWVEQMKNRLATLIDSEQLTIDN